MKPITFVVQRRRNHEFYKCDSVTRLRVTSYLLRVAAALLANENPSDRVSHFCDVESVRNLLLCQRAKMDWSSFEIEAFFGITWPRGRRRRVPLELVSERDLRYDDVRHLRVEHIEHIAATTAGVDPSVITKILAWGLEGAELTQEATPPVAATSKRQQPGASEIAILTDLVAELSERIAALEGDSDERPSLPVKRTDTARSILVAMRRVH